MLRKKARKPNPLKPDTRSAVRKGPARNKAHLEKVRAHHCIVCLTRGVHAHHCRHIAPRSIGVRVSDYLAVPLCPKCHARLHGMNEWAFWDTTLDDNNHLTDPAAWIAQFSPEGAAEIARINGAIVAPAKVRTP